MPPSLTKAFFRYPKSLSLSLVLSATAAVATATAADAGGTKTSWPTTRRSFPLRESYLHIYKGSRHCTAERVGNIMSTWICCCTMHSSLAPKVAIFVVHLNLPLVQFLGSSNSSPRSNLKERRQRKRKKGKGSCDFCVSRVRTRKERPSLPVLLPPASKPQCVMANFFFRPCTDFFLLMSFQEMRSDKAQTTVRTNAAIFPLRVIIRHSIVASSCSES